MKSIVIYFSMTGNTKKIAEAIQSGISLTSEVCDIVKLKDVNVKDLLDYDLIGIGSPVINGVPPNVKQFIDNMIGLDGKHTFTFCTHGIRAPRYFTNIIPSLYQRGLTVIGWKDWYGSVFLPYMPKPYFTDGHPDAIDLNEARDFGLEMISHSRRISYGETNLIPSLPRGKDYDAIYGNPGGGMTDQKLLTIMYFHFKLNREKCTRCGICEENCPSNSIDLSAFPYIWRTSCFRCWQCEQICPVGAIEANWEEWIKYHSPHIQNEAHNILVKEEKQGSFRRLVPIEQIGWDTPWYKIKAPPRYNVI